MKQGQHRVDGEGGRHRPGEKGGTGTGGVCPVDRAGCVSFRACRSVTGGSGERLEFLVDGRVVRIELGGAFPVLACPVEVPQGTGGVSGMVVNHGQILVQGGPVPVVVRVVPEFGLFRLQGALQVFHGFAVAALPVVDPPHAVQVGTVFGLGLEGAFD